MIFGARLVAVVTAMQLLSPSAQAQQFSLSDLQQIDGMINEKDCGGLWNFIQSRPGLTSGNDPLARELRAFSETIQRGAVNCFSAARVPAPPVEFLSWERH